MTADLVILGKIFTAEEKQLYAQGFAVADGKIIAVGSRRDMAEYIGEDTVVRDYASGMIVPGFTDGHAHVTTTIELTAGPYVGLDSIEEYQSRIKEFADAHPGEESILGNGFNPGLFGPKGPTADVIDAVVSDRPVMISDEGHHSLWVNTKAMEAAGITRDTPDPENGIIAHDQNGEPSGFFQEQATTLLAPVFPKVGVSDYEEAILYYQNIGLSNGITCVFEPIHSHSHDDAVRMDAYDKLEQEGKLKITYRVAQTLEPTDDEDTFFETLAGYHKRFADREKIQVNTVKFFTDGVVDGHTAVLREPYESEPFDCGPRIYEQDDLNKKAERALREGYSIHTHAIGDAAIDEALNAYEYAQKKVPGNYRNAITHLQVCQPDQPKRMKELGVVAVLNPYWHYETSLYEPLERPFLGEERATHMYYVKQYLDEGIVMSQASDFPVTVPPDTMFGLHMMVNRFDPKTSKEPYFPEECIGIEDALKAFTIGGAYENFLEEKKGSIKVGKDADFVVLSKDVTAIPKSKIHTTRVMETWIGGECCFECAN